MTRKIIDMTKDPRGGQFEYFRTMTDPWAGITVPVDITDLLASLNGRPFFLSYLYAVMRAANAVPELRRRLLPDGQVVEYDHCDPSYTVMKPDGTGVYVYCLLEDDLSSYEKFVAEGKRRQKETLERGTLTEDGDVLANFFVSCVPWLYYTQIKEPAGGADDSNPRFAWGKYREENGRMMLPMSLFINHALCDGWHVTQFYKNLDRELAELSAYLKTQSEQYTFSHIIPCPSTHYLRHASITLSIPSSTRYRLMIQSTDMSVNHGLQIIRQPRMIPIIFTISVK